MFLTQTMPEWLPVSFLSDPAWYYLFFFILFAITAWLRVNYDTNLLQILQASVNLHMARRMFNDNSLVQNQLDRILYLLYFLTLAFFIYLLEKKYHFHPFGLSGPWLYAANLLVFSLVVLVRSLLMRITGQLFNSQALVKEYLYNLSLYNFLIGISLLPLLFLMVYSRGFLQDFFFWFSCFMVIVLIFMRLFRAAILAFRKGVLIFYQILYLCALEIAPLILLFRWLKGVL